MTLPGSGPAATAARAAGPPSESGGNGRGRGWGVARLSSALLRPQRELPPAAPPAGITRSKSKHELKLLEKIPENAEATVVLVGMWGELGGQGAGGRACLGGAPALGAGRRLLLPRPCRLHALRLRGVPLPPHHGLRAATGGSGAGRGAGGAGARALPLPAAGSEQCQHGLP